MADGDGMIENALEVTRNLHRFIITVSLITLLFAVSLKLPVRERLAQSTITRFLEAKLTRYDAFVEARMKEALAPWVETEGAALRETLEGKFPLVWGTGELAEAFAKPQALGRFKAADTKLVTPSNFSLKELDSLAVLFPLQKDVRIVLPQMETILPQIQAFIQERGQTGARIINIRIDPLEADSADPVPEDGDIIKLTCYFELFANSPPIPVFQEGFNGKVQVIPHTSFQSWVSQDAEGAKIVRVEGERWTWLPELTDLSRDQVEKRLGDVLNALNDELHQGNPENRAVSLLGAEVPGSLLIYATPLVLLALSYYLLFHLVHLARFAVAHRTVMERFAWLPLSLERGWLWETVVSAGLLPLTALIVLSIQLLRFELLPWKAAVFMGLSLAIIGWLFTQSLTQMALIRKRIQRAAKVPWQKGA